MTQHSKLTLPGSSGRRAGAIVMAVLAALIVFGAAGADAASSGSITEFTAGLTPNAYPLGIAAGPDGNIWFTETNPGNAIGRISPDGAITEFSAGLNASSNPRSIVEGSDGNMWFTDNDNGASPAIGRITPTGTITEFSTGLNIGSLPLGITAGPDGNLWFADRGSTEAVGRITPNGTITEFSSGLPAGGINSSDVESITAGPDGNVWFTDNGNPSGLGRITPSGTISIFSFPFAGPEGVTAGPDGNLWFSNLASGNVGIGRMTPTGTATVFTTGMNTNSEPFGIATGADGNVWFADQGNTPAIGRITPTGTITEFGSGLDVASAPVLIAAGADGNLWFTDEGTGAQAVGRIGAGAPAASTASPVVTGTGMPGDPQSCAGATWSTWAGQAPSLSAYGFDGYTWLLDGSPIASQTTQSYTPVTGDLGHQLSCTVTVTYPLFPVTTLSTSGTVTVGGATPPVTTVTTATTTTTVSPTSSPATATSPVTTTPLVSTIPGGTTIPATTITSDVLFCVAKAATSRVKRPVAVCSGKPVGGPVTVTKGGPYRIASLTKSSVIYGSGLGWRMAHRTKLVLVLRRPLTAGTYTLHLAYNRDRVIKVP